MSNKSKNLIVISELTRQNEMLALVEELNTITPITRVIMKPTCDSKSAHKYTVSVIAADVEVIFKFKDERIAQLIAKVIHADTGAPVEIKKRKVSE